MTIFCYKKIDTAKHLGCEIKEAREKKQMSLDEVSKKTRIPLKYLSALEANRFFELPKAHAHRQAYLRELCTLYNLDFKTTFYKFRCEGGSKFLSLIYPQKIKRFKSDSFSIFARNLALISFVLFFIVYLGWQIHGIITPPKLLVYSPLEGQISNRAETDIQGETDKESQLEANGTEIKVNEQGKFSGTILLSNGVNTITLSTTKKHGKTTTVTRHVVVSIKEPAKVSIK